MPRAERDLESIFLYIGAEDSPAANTWFNGLEQAIETLQEHPLRSPRIKEDAALRHLLYGNKPHIYRIIYSVDDPRQEVNILHVSHSRSILHLVT